MKTPARGFSLIELMVAMAIGLIGCVVIFQAYSGAETRKRSIAAGSDMDVSGRLALMTLERALQAAGYGFGTAASASASASGSVLGCEVDAFDGLRPGGAQDFSFALTPVRIMQGAGGAPDSVAVLKGSSSLVAMAKPIDAVTATSLRVKTDSGGRTGIRPGERVIAVRTGGGLACALFEVTSDADPDQLTFELAASRYNKSGGLGFSLSGEGLLYGLGAAPALTVWSVRNARLVSTNELVWADANGDGQNDRIEAADLIVDLQAQYGVDADNDGTIADAEWTEVDPADWRRVLAVRFGLLARSQQFERDPVTATVPGWAAGSFVMNNVDGTPDSNPNGAGAQNNWRHYRYSVFQAVVPLRNTIIGRQL